jgi:hypothetical protein
MIDYALGLVHWRTSRNPIRLNSKSNNTASTSMLRREKWSAVAPYRSLSVRENVQKEFIYIINKRKRAAQAPLPQGCGPVSALACAWSRTGVPEPPESLPDHPLRNHYTTLPTLYMLQMPTKYEPLRYPAPSGPGVERGISDER